MTTVTTGKHADATGINIHVPYAFEYADATERATATGFVPTDVGKLARQLDDNSLWMLTDDDPETWVQVGGAATDDAAIHDDEAGEINAITEKMSVADDDVFLIEDSAASYAKKRVKASNLPSGGGGGTDLIGAASYHVKMERVEGYNIPVSTTYTVCNLTTQSGTMLALFIACSGVGVSRDSVVKIYVDGEGSPSIQFDLGTMGLHFPTGDSAQSTRHVAVEQDTAASQSMLVFKFPVPFATSLQIDIQNVSASVQARVFTQVFYTNDVTDGRRLKSAGLTFLNKATVAAANTYEFLDYSAGGGVLVWHSLAGQGASNLTYLERDVEIEVDGVTTIQATSTEDWFSGAWYYSGGPRSFPWAMMPFAGGASYRSMQALDLLEFFGGIRFESSLVVTWGTEAAVTTSADMSYVLLYYVD